jgi:hypothetical protein
VRIEDPSANSMASFKFTSAVLPEGTTLVFGSWVCVADGAGDFRQFTIDIMHQVFTVSSMSLSTPYLKLTTSGIPLCGQAVKHRQIDF